MQPDIEIEVVISNQLVDPEAIEFMYSSDSQYSTDKYKITFNGKNVKKYFRFFNGKNEKKMDRLEIEKFFWDITNIKINLHRPFPGKILYFINDITNIESIEDKIIIEGNCTKIP